MNPFKKPLFKKHRLGWVALMAAGLGYLTPHAQHLSTHLLNKGISAAEDQAPKRLTGTVTRVADGDTLTLIDQNGLKHKVRLLGIDAPEMQQAHGKAARTWLASQALDRTAQIEVATEDRYRRQVAKVLLPAADCAGSHCEFTRDVNLQLVQLGHAWWYARYQNNQPETDRPLYRQAQQTAETNRMGLWARPRPIAPWDWRKKQR